MQLLNFLILKTVTTRIRIVVSYLHTLLNIPEDSIITALRILQLAKWIYAINHIILISHWTVSL